MLFHSNPSYTISIANDNHQNILSTLTWATTFPPRYGWAPTPQEREQIAAFLNDPSNSQNAEGKTKLVELLSQWHNTTSREFQKIRAYNKQIIIQRLYFGSLASTFIFFPLILVLVATDAPSTAILTTLSLLILSLATLFTTWFMVHNEPYTFSAPSINELITTRLEHNQYTALLNRINAENVPSTFTDTERETIDKALQFFSKEKRHLIANPVQVKVTSANEETGLLSSSSTVNAGL